MQKNENEKWWNYAVNISKDQTHLIFTIRDIDKGEINKSVSITQSQRDELKPLFCKFFKDEDSFYLKTHSYNETIDVLLKAEISIPDFFMAYYPFFHSN